MKTKRILSIALTLVMLLGMLPGMNLTAYAANNLTIYIMDMLENMDDNEWGYQLYDGDVSIAEGTYVQINMGTWHTGVMNIYMNGEVVYTKPSGSLYKDDVYHFTAGPNCKILGGYQNMFDWAPIRRRPSTWAAASLSLRLLSQLVPQTRRSSGALAEPTRAL